MAIQLLPESKEQIKESKDKQKAIIADCDKAIADIQYNMDVLQKALTAQNEAKTQAQSTLDDLNTDFPDIPAVVDVVPGEVK